MARQASEAKRSPQFDLVDWHNKWFDERARYPCAMIVWIDEPLKENEWVSVVVFPHTDRRDILGCFNDPRYRDNGYEVSRCFFHELLGGESISRLTTILSIIRQLQGLDFRQGLAFLVQIFIMVIDNERAKRGNESILFGPTVGQFDWNTPEGQRQLDHLANRPIWTFKGLFKFWDLLGGRLASGFSRSPDGSPGQPNYLAIPPTWLPVAKLTEIHGDNAQSLKIPILVEPAYKPLMESFLGFYRANGQANVALNLSFGAQEGEHKSGNIDGQATTRKEDENQADFQFSPDFRSIALRGRQFTFTPRQAQIVQRLYEAYKAGTPEVGQDTLLVELELQSQRLRDIFKSTPGTWGEVIVRGKKRGTYRLNL